MRSPPRPDRLSLLLAVAAALALPLAAAPSASAHAAFVESQPPPGQRLEQTPARIVLEFTEPLNRKLTRAELVRVASGERVRATLEASPDRQLILRPSGPLETGPYRVDWHTVSTQDGHALEGSFGFGVRAAAVGGEQSVEQSPLARDGWLRVALRTLLYGSLFFFAGGLVGAALLSWGRRPAAWLVPTELAAALEGGGRDPEGLAGRLWRRTLDAGWLAACAAVAVAVVEAEDASGGLSLSGLSDYLLGNVAGFARVATVGAIVLAVLHAKHLRLPAVVWATVAFMAIAIGGHANSAEPRALAVLTDWVHLLAASVWVGGIAQVASAWAFGLRALGHESRRAVMRSVLARFGRVALPAFLLVASTGLTNALIQLGQVSALWETAYGRVLAVKIGLVGAIALASYVHALRLRPRLLAANPHPDSQLERRHWRLLRAEPAMAIGVVAAAALLTVFPLPPRQLGEAGEAEAGSRGAAACDPCPQPKPRAGELAVAEQAGSSIAAFWLHPEDGGVRGELRLLGRDLDPRRAEVRIEGASQRGCGRGCWTFRVPGRPAAVAARVQERGRTYVARVPARWDPAASRAARRLLERAQRTMARLRSLRQDETITSGPGTFLASRYRLEAPDRFAYRTNSGAESIVIGRHQWFRSGGQLFERQAFGGGGPGFRTRSWFRWTSYARFVRLLQPERSGGRRLLRLALMDEATPVWYRLWIDPATMRVLRVRMIAEGHFMTQRFHSFNEPVQIESPPKVDRAR
jgi:copper transport protein